MGRSIRRGEDMEKPGERGEKAVRSKETGGKKIRETIIEIWEGGQEEGRNGKIVSRNKGKSLSIASTSPSSFPISRRQCSPHSSLLLQPLLQALLTTLYIESSFPSTFRVPLHCTLPLTQAKLETPSRALTAP
ncbi:hypothetical protein Pcinc_040363 [Petrolisthes cinctipes]|uniref:Uncharacterized protein n=1 Tax=Petrolisthes cinctipes TaxID=88211 RepID=A0AAE1EI46_PETCI|nr:hypothetical protein Pcinc_040363 [Petrolisthes cinctipes]